MKAELYWIPSSMPGRLAVMPRPRGGDWLEDEIKSWRSEGVDLVLSLLTPEEVLDLDLDQEEMLCQLHGIEFRAFPSADRDVPASKAAVLSLVTELSHDLLRGKNLAIHCRQGIGRAPLIAIVLLVLSGLNLKDALSAVGQARGLAVPETIEQTRWLSEFVRGIPTIVSK